MSHHRLIHGTPITPARLLEQLRGESFCVSFADPRQVDRCVELVGEEEILLLDNGAFTAWRQGGTIDREAFWSWANSVQERCPQAVAVIPDVIEGNEEENLLEASLAVRDGLARFPERTMFVWHMDDSDELLVRAARLFNFIAIGSCAEFDVQKNRAAYLERLRHASAIIQWVEIKHRRRPWVHLMRGLGALHLAKWFDSADSSNIARNHCRTRGQENHVAAMAKRIREKVAA